MPTPNEEWQELQDHTNTESRLLVPVNPTRLWLSNLIRRTWAAIWAMGPNGIVQIQATADGRLKVAQTTGGFSDIDVISGNGTNAFVTETFPTIEGAFEISIDSYGAIIQTSADGITFGDSVNVGAGQVFDPPVSVKSFKIMNETAGQNCNYQAIGYN